MCSISATLSLSGLRALGVVPATDLMGNWITWWVGDTLGVLVALPLTLVLVGEPQSVWRSRARFVAVPMVLCFALFSRCSCNLTGGKRAIVVAVSLGCARSRRARYRSPRGSAATWNRSCLPARKTSKRAPRKRNPHRSRFARHDPTSSGEQPSDAGRGADRKSLDKVIETAVAISGANKGYVEFLDPGTGTLVLAAQRGFDEPSLKLFRQVRETTGVGSTEPTIIEDLRTEEKLPGAISRGLIDAGIRAVTSTPLLSSTGNVLGIVTTLFDTPHHPGERELRLMDLLARQTADYLERKHAEKIQKTLVGEVQHRSNNLLAIIQAIAHRSFSGDTL